VPSTNKTLPMGMPKQAAPAPAPPKTAAPAPRAARAQPLMARPALQGAESEKRGPSRAVLVLLALVFALGVGMTVAVLTRPPRTARPTSAVPQSVAHPPATTAAAATATTGAAPIATPTATASTAPAAVTTPSALATAAPAASAAAIPSATPTPSATASPSAAATADAPAPIASADLTKLPPERAYLLVRSSVDTHVFVHGTDYGPTNQLLMTSCGIRFVRLGRALGDFVEPGSSRVIKCGRLNEFAIEVR
jgi:hypothetical protein